MSEFQRFGDNVRIAGRVSDKVIRFFRYEVQDRWNQLSPDEVTLLEGDLSQLVNLVQDRYDYTIRRARVEVQDFLFEFESKIAAAQTSRTPKALSAPTSFVA